MSICYLLSCFYRWLLTWLGSSWLESSRVQFVPWNFDSCYLAVINRGGHPRWLTWRGCLVEERGDEGVAAAAEPSPVVFEFYPLYRDALVRNWSYYSPRWYSLSQVNQGQFNGAWLEGNENSAKETKPTKIKLKNRYRARLIRNLIAFFKIQSIYIEYIARSICVRTISDFFLFYAWELPESRCSKSARKLY